MNKSILRRCTDVPLFPANLQISSLAGLVGWLIDWFVGWLIGWLVR